MLRLRFRTCVWLRIPWHSYETTHLEEVTVHMKRLHYRFYISSISRSVLAEWNAIRGTAYCITCGKINNLFTRCYQYGTLTVTTKTVPGKVAKTCTKDGHKQTTKTSTKIQTKRTKNHRTTEEEMEGPTSSWGSRNRITCLTLQEHDDDDIKCQTNLSIHINMRHIYLWTHAVCHVVDRAILTLIPLTWKI